MRPVRAAGFTLPEMLVALIVFGLLMAGITQTMRYGVTAWRAETSAAADPADMAAADGALRRLIEQALPDGFNGQPDQMAFTAPLPAGAGLTDPLADVALVTTPDHRLVLRWVPHPAGVPLKPPAAARAEPLLNDVLGIDLEYLTDRAVNQSVWAPQWSGGGLPLLVKLHIQFTDGRVWPDLVAAPRAQGGQDAGS